ncbi:hypothetical protein GIB67_000707, partial [Kingdonia uniflora]
CKQLQIKVTDTKLFTWKTCAITKWHSQFCYKCYKKDMKIMVQSYEVLNVNFDENLHTLDTLGIP